MWTVAHRVLHVVNDHSPNFIFQILPWIYVRGRLQRLGIWYLHSHVLDKPVYHFLIQQVLSAATIVAKHTSALCNACRLASSKTTNPVAKRHFVQSAKEVANSTANLVKTIKVLFQSCQRVDSVA